MINKRLEKLKNKIEKLKNQIIEYIKNGGDLYASTRKLPYYVFMMNIKRDLNNYYGKLFSVSEIYEMCGIEFDREQHDLQIEYEKFLDFYKNLQKFADKNGYVDNMKDPYVQKSDDTYYKLLCYANKYNCATCDFLILMTNFNLKKSYVQVDYIANLAQEIKRVYPDGHLPEGIRRSNPEIYEKLRHLRRLFPNHLSMKEIAEIVGCENRLFQTNSFKLNIDKNQVLKQINILCPDKNVTNLVKINDSVYRQALALARYENKSLYEWLTENGYQYETKSNIARLARAFVDTNRRKLVLLSLKNDLLQNYNLSNIDELTMFKINLEVLQQAVKIANTDFEISGINLINETSQNLNELI